MPAGAALGSRLRAAVLPSVIVCVAACNSLPIASAGACEHDGYEGSCLLLNAREASGGVPEGYVRLVATFSSSDGGLLHQQYGVRREQVQPFLAKLRTAGPMRCRAEVPRSQACAPEASEVEIPLADSPVLILLPPSQP